MLKNIEDVSPIEEFRLDVYLLEFTRHCGTMVVSVSSERQVVGPICTRENILAIVERCPRLSTCRMASRIGGVSNMLVLRALHEEDYYPYHDQSVQHLEPSHHAKRMDLCRWIQAHPELLGVILFTDEA